MVAGFYFLGLVAAACGALAAASSYSKWAWRVARRVAETRMAVQIAVGRGKLALAEAEVAELRHELEVQELRGRIAELERFEAARVRELEAALAHARERADTAEAAEEQLLAEAPRSICEECGRLDERIAGAVDAARRQRELCRGAGLSADDLEC
ncbi:MAG TPA: hypothetical protein VEA41_00385 [Salinarimonas sp.]|nr:hypothetical protein [Salinarimonas sp.]